MFCWVSVVNNKGRDTFVPQYWVKVIMDFIHKGIYTYSQSWDLRDTRVDHLPLMGSCLPSIVIAGIYVYLVKVLGPQLMEKRSPFQLR